jgi:hypothetical protein
MFILYRESLMKYTGRHANDFTVYIWLGDYPLGSPQCSGNNDDMATGVGGDRWYQFQGLLGSRSGCVGCRVPPGLPPKPFWGAYWSAGLPTKPPGRDHCGTGGAGWLSGWDPSKGPPPLNFKGSGAWPVPNKISADGHTQYSTPVKATVCFDWTGQSDHTCDTHVNVTVAACGKRSGAVGKVRFALSIMFTSEGSNS